MHNIDNFLAGCDGIEVVKLIGNLIPGGTGSGAWGDTDLSYHLRGSAGGERLADHGPEDVFIDGPQVPGAWTHQRPRLARRPSHDQLAW